jgi:phospholipid transport system substrate-binding protein
MQPIQSVINAATRGVRSVIVGLCLATSLGVQAQVFEKDPVQQVKLVSEQLMQRLDQERVQLEQQAEKVQILAESMVFPYVDINKMARFVMGAHWRTASPSEQQAFSEAFKKILINSYARSFLKMQIDHLEMGNSRQGAGKGDVEVPVTVVEKSGNAIPVLFRLLPNGESWKVYDLEIQGISLLLNYRAVYGLEIEAKGLSSVISSMQAQAKGL